PSFHQLLDRGQDSREVANQQISEAIRKASLLLLRSSRVRESSRTRSMTGLSMLSRLKAWACVASHVAMTYAFLQPPVNQLGNPFPIVFGRTFFHLPTFSITHAELMRLTA